MDYNELQGLYNELEGDTSDMGVKKFQIFRELLGSAGTGAAATLVVDLLKAGKLEDRDGGRMLSSIPYHIRYPSKQLMNYMGTLLDMVPSLGQDKRFTKDIGAKFIGKFKAMYDSASTKEDKSQALN